MIWAKRPDPAGPVADAVIAHGLIEAVDTIGDKVEAGHVVLDLVDALQVLVDDLERRFQLVQAVGTAGGFRAGRATMR